MSKLFIILDSYEQTISPKDSESYILKCHHILTSDPSNYIYATVSECNSDTRGVIEVDGKYYKQIMRTNHPTIGLAFNRYCKEVIRQPNKDILNCLVLENILKSQVAKKVEMSKEFDMDMWINSEE